MLFANYHTLQSLDDDDDDDDDDDTLDWSNLSPFYTYSTSHWKEVGNIEWEAAN